VGEGVFEGACVAVAGGVGVSTIASVTCKVGTTFVGDDEQAVANKTTVTAMNFLIQARIYYFLHMIKALRKLAWLGLI